MHQLGDSRQVVSVQEIPFNLSQVLVWRHAFACVGMPNCWLIVYLHHEGMIYGTRSDARNRWAHLMRVARFLGEMDGLLQ